MEEIEVPTEHLQEEIHEAAHHARESWISWVALSSALLAGLAAVSSLLAGHHVNEAMVEQMQASDQWSFYQAKGVKASVLASKNELLQALGHSVSQKDEEKIADYRKEQAEIKHEADEKQVHSAHHMGSHVIFARAVTMFQVAIAVAAIAVLTRRRRFWFVGMGFGIVGIFFLLQGLLH